MKTREEARAYLESLARMVDACPKHGEDCLTDKTRQCAYALAADGPMRMEDIAAHMGVHCTAIQQTIDRAKPKLRRRLAGWQ